MLDLKSILKTFTELKLEEEVLHERFNEIKEEKSKLICQLKKINKDDISNRMDELLPYHLEYEFLKKNLKEFEEIDSITDIYTDDNMYSNEEENSDNNKGCRDMLFREYKNAERTNPKKPEINTDNNVKELTENDSHTEDNELDITENKTDIKAENNTDIYTDNNVKENEYINTDRNECDNVEELTEDDSYTEDNELDITENKTDIKAEDNTDIYTDKNTENSVEQKTDSKQKLLFKDLNTEEKIKYIISVIDASRSKVKEIIEFWNGKDNPEEKNKGLIILRDLRRVKSSLYNEEEGKIKPDINVQTINESLNKLQQIKENIESYSFEKEKEEINDKYEN